MRWHVSRLGRGQWRGHFGRGGGGAGRRLQGAAEVVEVGAWRFEPAMHFGHRKPFLFHQRRRHHLLYDAVHAQSFHRGFRRRDGGARHGYFQLDVLKPPTHRVGDFHFHHRASVRAGLARLRHVRARRFVVPGVDLVRQVVLGARVLANVLDARVGHCHEIEWGRHVYFEGGKRGERRNFGGGHGGGHGGRAEGGAVRAEQGVPVVEHLQLDPEGGQEAAHAFVGVGLETAQVRQRRQRSRQRSRERVPVQQQSLERVQVAHLLRDGPRHGVFGHVQSLCVGQSTELGGEGTREGVGVQPQCVQIGQQAELSGQASVQVVARELELHHGAGQVFVPRLAGHAVPLRFARHSHHPVRFHRPIGAVGGFVQLAQRQVRVRFVG